MKIYADDDLDATDVPGFLPRQALLLRPEGVVDHGTRNFSLEAWWRFYIPMLAGVGRLHFHITIFHCAPEARWRCNLGDFLSHGRL
ncbi:hypothetical protein E2C01_008742 [Portunus trituberculatus]|uniref:Uncharacterized protein n=1 Tax=Portunus trituberculatus TaxID=210409 RepID=A0A5B7D516_PORTR|nr:hypothetical protein [Portunus trituberculatus]